VIDDRSEFDREVANLQGRVKQILRRYLRDPDDIGDALQQTWLKAWANRAQFRGQARYSSWVTRIAINEALQILRSAARTRWLPLEDFEITTPPTGTDHIGLERKLSSLPESYRIVLQMHAVYGMTDAEIASAERITLGAAKSRLFRARMMVREQIAA
jgi:RNA polymerase sigma-70 factor (ECF subfamily)